MTRQQHRQRITTNALRLDRARGLLTKVHLQFTLLGDVAAAYRVNRIIISLQVEHQRWLSAVDTPVP